MRQPDIVEPIVGYLASVVTIDQGIPDTAQHTQTAEAVIVGIMQRIPSLLVFTVSQGSQPFGQARKWLLLERSWIKRIEILCRDQGFRSEFQ